MLSWCRRRAHQIATALLVAVAALALPHTFDVHHDADGHGFVFHDESSHRISAPNPAADHSGHCVACHAGRSFRLATAGLPLAPPVAPAAAHFVPHPSAAASGQEAAQPPLRAPPPTPASV
jgi:hypothetical protein